MSCQRCICRDRYTGHRSGIQIRVRETLEADRCQNMGAELILRTLSSNRLMLRNLHFSQSTLSPPGFLSSCSKRSGLVWHMPRISHQRAAIWRSLHPAMSVVRRNIQDQKRNLCFVAHRSGAIAQNLPSGIFPVVLDHCCSWAFRSNLPFSILPLQLSLLFMNGDVQTRNG